MMTKHAGGRARRSGSRWRAVVARDASADGTFVYSVRSTGVYCRPSCPARLREAGERAIPRDLRGRGARGLPAVQALQAGSGGARGAAGGEGRRDLPVHRSGGSCAFARRAGEARGHERVSLPSRVQGGDRRNAGGLCAGRAGETRARGARRSRAIGDRGDLRRRIQFQQPVLREVGRSARHEAVRIPRGRREHRDPFLGRRMFAGIDPGGAERARRVRDLPG